MSESPAVFIKPDALKQMIAWSLLCLGILEKKDQDFAIVLRTDGIVVQLK
jgi:hypothetical protein